MAGYTRQSVFTDGDDITAGLFNDEYNQTEAAFNASTGHKHDGTTGEGAPVPLISSPDGLNKVVVNNTDNSVELFVDVSSSAVKQLVFKDGVIEPATDDDIDLGSSSKKFKDLYIDGVVYADSINGYTIGTNVQAYDAGLQSISGLTTSADKMIYTTASDTYAVTDLTSFARTILDDADAATARTTLGGGATGSSLFTAATAATARSTLGATTVGGNVFTLTNPSAVTFLRLNADNTVTALSAADFRVAIGATATANVAVLNSSGSSFFVNT
jgi:hypothetical protein